MFVGATRKVAVFFICYTSLAGFAHGQLPWSYSSYVGGISAENVRASAVDGDGNFYIAGTTYSAGKPFTSARETLQTSPSVFLSKFDKRGQVLYHKILNGTRTLGALHVDRSGNTYVTGSTTAGFQTTANALQPRFTPAFIVKFAPNGSILYSTFFPFANAINTDAAGNLVLCGSSAASFVPITANAYRGVGANLSATVGFCSKISSDGTRVIASTVFGPDSETHGSNFRYTSPTAVATDSKGNFIVAGSEGFSSFPLLNPIQTDDRRRSLFRLDAGSAAWTSAEDGTLFGINTIEFDPQQRGRMFIGSDAGLGRSDDAGRSWQVISTTETVAHKIHPLNSNYQLRVTSSFLVECTRDGGATWERVIDSNSASFIPVATSNSLAAVDQIAADVTSEGVFFIAARSPIGLLRFNAQTRARTQLLPFSTATFVAQTGTGTVFYFIPDAGWFRMRDGQTERIVDFPPVQRLRMAGSNPNVIYGQSFYAPTTLWRSSDGGDTWREFHSFPCRRPVLIDPQSVLYVDPQSEDVLYSACNPGGVYRSSDGGQTWQLFDAGLFHGNIRVFAKNSAGNLWAGALKYENSFIMRISSDATTLLSSTILGGTSGAGINALLLDPEDRIIITGGSLSVDFPETETIPSSDRYDPGFLMRLTPDASHILVSRKLEKFPSATARDTTGRLHFIGSTYDDLAVTNDAEQSTFGGGTTDGFWSVLSADYAQIVHSTYLGGSSSDYALSVSMMPDNRTVIAGYTASENFPTTANAAQVMRAGLPGLLNTDGFVTLSPNSSSGSQPITAYIPTGGARNITTAGRSVQVRSGYATATASTPQAPYGTAVFGLTQNGVTVSEAGVPASGLTTNARVFIDFRNGVPLGSGTINVNTGVAIVNPGSASASITLILRSLQGEVLATGTGIINAGGHIAQFVDELQSFAPDFRLRPGFADSTGFATLDLASVTRFSVTALRLTVNQRGETLLTTTPVADLTRAPSTASLVFPQFADGGGYTNTLILVNTSTAPEAGIVRFRDDTGAVLPMTLSGVRNTEFPYTIARDGAVVLETAGTGQNVQVGSIEVIPNAGTAAPDGAGVFRLVQNGVVVTESGVPAAQPSTHMRIYLDTSNGHDTGIAFANPTDSSVDIQLSVTLMDGIGVGANASTPVTLPPRGHAAKFIGEFVEYWRPGSKGVVEISASVPVSALTMRSLNNQRHEFLLTTFPVADLNRAAPAAVFPQIASGDGYRTEIILISPGTDPVSSTVLLLDAAGQPLDIYP